MRPMQPATPEEWIRRCTQRLREQIRDQSINLDDLAGAAADMLEMQAYGKLGPEEAAEAWARFTR